MLASIAQKPVDQFRDALAVRARRHPVSSIAQGRHGIGDGDGTAARFQERVVILTIPNRNNVDRRQREVTKRSQKPACLIDSSWQNHHGAFVEDNLQFQAEFVECFQQGILLGLPGRDDDSAGRERRYIARP
jgi:hypothetical protein